MLQVTYRVIHVAEGQMEAPADGTAAVSVVTGFPAATQAGSPPLTRVTGLVAVVSLLLRTTDCYCVTAFRTTVILLDVHHFMLIGLEPCCFLFKQQIKFAELLLFE